MGNRRHRFTYCYEIIFLKTLHRTLTIICCFAAALLISWKLLHQLNYGYSFWYSNLGIESHIARYAPQNRFDKTGFEQTTEDQRVELFRAIGHAVNHSGEGLRELNYPQPDGTSQIFLTDAEATHLEDVANLIDLLEPIGWAATATLLLLVVLAVLLKIPLPSFGVSVATILGLTLLAGFVILVIGPHEVFKLLHEAIFPDEHQWFFYYQDSLMTTLMKAPDIFFAIGAVWAGLAVVTCLLLSVLLRLLDRTRV